MKIKNIMVIALILLLVPIGTCEQKFYQGNVTLYQDTHSSGVGCGVLTEYKFVYVPEQNHTTYINYNGYQWAACSTGRYSMVSASAQNLNPDGVIIEIFKNYYYSDYDNTHVNDQFVYSSTIFNSGADTKRFYFRIIKEDRFINFTLNYFIVGSNESMSLNYIKGNLLNVSIIGLMINNGTHWNTLYNDSAGLNYEYPIAEGSSYKLISNTNEYEFVGENINITYNIDYNIYPPSNDTYTNHTAKFDELLSVLTVWSFITVIFGTYEFYNGATLFWLILIMIPYTMMWIKQGSVIIPATMALLSGSILFTLVPAESIAPIKILLTVGIAGIFYHIIKSR